MESPASSPPSEVVRPRWLLTLVVDVIGFCVLALACLATGLLGNELRSKPLPLWYVSKEERLGAVVGSLSANAPLVRTSAVVGSPREIALDEFQALALGRKGTVIDARSPFFYHQSHVPGAINLSREDFGPAYQRLSAQLTARKADAVAVYCSDADCPDAGLVASALEALGYRRMFVYREGWEEWSKSGLPQEK